MFARGGQGSRFSSGARAAALLGVYSGLTTACPPESTHSASPSGQLGTGTPLATKTHPQNGVVIFLHSCHFLNLVCCLVIQTSAGATGGAVGTGTRGKHRK